MAETAADDPGDFYDLFDHPRAPSRQPPTPAGRAKAPTPRGNAYAQAGAGAEVERLNAMARAATPGGVGYTGEPWDATTFEVACNLLELANSPWNDLTPDAAMQLVRDHAPRDCRFADRDVEHKIKSAMTTVGTQGRDLPPPSLPEVTTLVVAANGDDHRTPEQVEADREAAFTREVAAEVERLRVRDAARDIVAREKAGESKPFDAGTLATVLARPPEPPYRVPGLIPADGGTLLVAQRKTGKTTWCLNLARALLDGGPFLGRYHVGPVRGRVAFLNFEVSAATLARWADETHIPRERLFVVNVRGRRNPFRHPDDLAALAALLGEHDVETLFVDPFGRAYPGNSQNDAGEVNAWLAQLDAFAREDLGARDVILATHAGWNGERTRGSSALEDWADVVVTLTRGREDDPTRYMRAFGRDVDLDEDALSFEPSTRTLTLTGGGSRAVADRTRAVAAAKPQVLAYLANHPRASGADIERDVEGNAGTIRAARDALVAAHQVVEEVRRGRGGGKCYSLTQTSSNLVQPRPDEVGTSSTSSL